MDVYHKPAAISAHFQGRKPSEIRLAQMEFTQRKDGVEAINTAIGNVSLPMHPALIERMRRVGEVGSPFAQGIVQYTPTVGLEETNRAFLKIIGSSGFATEGLYSQITNGGSQGMELVILGVCGPAGSGEKPLLLIDAAYTNYVAMAGRLGRRTVSVTRSLYKDGMFSLPDLEEIERVIEREQPGGMVIIPYDNPTGQFFNQETVDELARLAVKQGMWIVSDEAYRELQFTGEEASSIWGADAGKIPGIEGSRVSLETMSKVWNGCGLRIGALVTDNVEFHRASVAENTADLCASSIDQWIAGALAEVSVEELQAWYRQQREYYRPMIQEVRGELIRQIPGLIVSQPEASIYSVVDVRDVVQPGFEAREFVLWCAREGKVGIGGKEWTLLVAPMAGFYGEGGSRENAGKTQMRIAYVEPPEKMALVPELFGKLLEDYEAKR